MTVRAASPRVVRLPLRKSGTGHPLCFGQARALGPRGSVLAEFTWPVCKRPTTGSLNIDGDSDSHRSAAKRWGRAGTATEVKSRQPNPLLHGVKPLSGTSCHIHPPKGSHLADPCWAPSYALPTSHNTLLQAAPGGALSRCQEFLKNQNNKPIGLRAALSQCLLYP